MFSFFFFNSNKKCTLEHVVNKGCLIDKYQLNFIDTPWNSVELHRYSKSMELQGQSMEFHGITWNSVELHGIPWNSMNTPRNSMAFHGIPWNSMNTPRILHGHSMEVPWNSMEVFHTGCFLQNTLKRFFRLSRVLNAF